MQRAVLSTALILLLGLTGAAQMMPFSFWRTHHLFVWFGGASVQNQSGAYGTLGTGGTANTPGQRADLMRWKDASGNLWLFGGYGYDSEGILGPLNDLWEYTPSNGKWTWVSGASLASQAGTYGSVGTGSVSNVPGGRLDAVTWFDGTNLWLFGGNGMDSAGNWGDLNDLWKFTPSNLKWTWVGGPNLSAQAGTYGTIGIGSTGNIPGGRDQGISWFDGTNMWLFGGNQGFDGSGNAQALNDLWEYTPSNGKWTWVAGSSSVNQGGTFGTLGAASVSYIPGARLGSHSWIDGSGNFWLFGGNGRDSAVADGDLNDLWKFTPGTKTWAWIAGSKLNGVSGTYGTQGSGSTANTPGAYQSGTSVVDSSGNFWLLGGYGYDSTGSLGFTNEIWKFDPTTKNWTWISGTNTANAPGTYGVLGTGSAANTPGSRNSTAAWAGTSGTLWIFGGYGFPATGYSTYLNDLWQLDPANLNWTWQSGASGSGAAANYGTQGVAGTGNNPGARDAAVGWMDATGNYWLFGGTGVDLNNNQGPQNDLWKYSPVAKTWTWLKGSATNGASGTYGTKGTGTVSTVPGGRNSPAQWTDASGNTWIFGGQGFDGAGSFGELSDLWEYTPGNGQWTWISGFSTADHNPVGTLGTGAVGNTPGARDSAHSWFDGTNLWLFGGVGRDSAGNSGALGDLWKFTPSNLKWTWVAGSSIRNVKGTYGVQGTAAAGNSPGGRSLAGAWADVSGNLWLFGGAGYGTGAGNGALNDLWKYNITAGQWTWVSGASVVNSAATYGTKGSGATGNIPGGRWGSQAWADRSGNLWLFGGWGYDSAGATDLLNDVWMYAPATNQWTWVNGANLVDQNGVYGTVDGMAATSLPGARYYGAKPAVDSGGTVWLFGGRGYDSLGNKGQLNDFWKYTP
jgi:N-acetylneuraminic acid mutarotase